MIVVDQETRDKYGEFKAFEAHELPDSKGWHLIAVIQEKSMEVRQQEIKCPGPPANGSASCRHGHYSGSTCYSSDYVDVPGEVMLTKYLMGRDKHEVLGDMRLEMEKLEEERQKAIMSREEAIKSQTETAEQLEKARAHIKTQEEGYAKKCDKVKDQEQRITNHLSTINKLEEDLGKLRDEYGAASVRQVLGH